MHLPSEPVRVYALTERESMPGPQLVYLEPVLEALQRVVDQAPNAEWAQRSLMYVLTVVTELLDDMEGDTLHLVD